MKICKKCAINELGEWEGEPHIDDLPYVPEIKNDGCPVCYGKEVIDSKQLAWEQVKPDTDPTSEEPWRIYIGGPGDSRAKELQEKYRGLPYIFYSTCKNCNSPSINNTWMDKESTSCTNCLSEETVLKISVG